MRGAIVACAVAGAASRSVARTTRQSSPIENCPGYHASNINIGDSFITADLTLAGPPCNTYGTDLTDLKLEVNFETGKKGNLLLTTCRLLSEGFILESQSLMGKLSDTLTARRESSPHTDLR